MICLSMPDGADGAWKTPQPAVASAVTTAIAAVVTIVAAPAVPATDRAGVAAAAAYFLAKSFVFLTLTALFSPCGHGPKRRVVE